MIISASRRTDIPAFYSDWFIKRIQEGYVCVRNPMFPKKVSRILLNTETVDCIVFWTKNPSPIIPKLDFFKDYTYYFQFTLNPYSNLIERNLPDYKSRLNTFIELSEKIGKDRVIWRYDPILLTKSIDVQYHISHFEEMAEALRGYTNKVVISILDYYNKIKNNMRSIEQRDMSGEELKLLLTAFKEIVDKYNLVIQSCAEDIDLKPYGINPGKCIDDQLISNLIGEKLIIPKDKNQREVCQCVESVDIGAYNTCLHNCRYCYANFNDKIVQENYEFHDMNSPFLFGNSKVDDVISEKKIKTYRSLFEQITLFNENLR